jgi:hypothetical protein
MRRDCGRQLNLAVLSKPRASAFSLTLRTTSSPNPSPDGRLDLDGDLHLGVDDRRESRDDLLGDSAGVAREPLTLAPDDRTRLERLVTDLEGAVAQLR